MWENSIFKDFRNFPTRTKGAKFESIAKLILEEKGYRVDNPESTEYDFIVDDLKCELKGTLLGKNGKVSFLQIRPDQKYNILLLMVIDPSPSDTIHFYKIPKIDVNKLIRQNIFRKQHGGNKADSRTYIYGGTTKKLSKWYWFSATVFQR